MIAYYCVHDTSSAILHYGMQALLWSYDLCSRTATMKLCLRSFFFLLLIGKVWIYRLLFVCLCVGTVADFSAEDKASGAKFCTVVHRRPGQRISHFGELCFPRSPKSDEQETSLACRPRLTDVRAAFYLQFCGRAGRTPRQRCAVREIALRVDVGSACVYIRPSPKADVLVYHSNSNLRDENNGDQRKCCGCLWHPCQFIRSDLFLGHSQFFSDVKNPQNFIYESQDCKQYILIIHG